MMHVFTVGHQLNQSDFSFSPKKVTKKEQKQELEESLKK